MPRPYVPEWEAMVEAYAGFREKSPTFIRTAMMALPHVCGPSELLPVMRELGWRRSRWGRECDLAVVGAALCLALVEEGYDTPDLVPKLTEELMEQENFGFNPSMCAEVTRLTRAWARYASREARGLAA